MRAIDFGIWNTTRHDDSGIVQESNLQRKYLERKRSNDLVCCLTMDVNRSKKGDDQFVD